MTDTTDTAVKRDVRGTPRWSRVIVGSTSAMTFTLAQMAPMVLITAAFLLRGDELAGAQWGGIPIVLHLAATSVIVPLAAQAFAGPVYIAVSGIPRRDHTAIAARCVRVLPRSIHTGAPVSVLLGIIVGSAMALTPTELIAFFAYLALNVAFAVSLTFAYVVSSAPIVILGWGVFAGALAAAPTVWWLPSAAATVVCAVAVWSVARVHGRDEAPMPSLRSSAAASARGVATALPLSGLPLMVFIDDPRGTSMAALFLAILPAVLLYQIYFSLVARRLWGEIDSFRRGLEARRAGVARRIDGADPPIHLAWRSRPVLGHRRSALP